MMTKKIYPPTGTCYWCDKVLPEGRLTLDLPARYFCSHEHLYAYKRRYPARYRAIEEQGERERQREG